MEFCDAPIWDLELSWVDAVNANFTQCFRDTLLIWTPCVVFFLCALAEYFLNRQRELALPWTAFFFAKLSICAILVTIQILEMWDLKHRDGVITYSQCLSPLIQLFTLIAVAIFTVHNKLRGRITSFALFIFWLTYSLATGIRFRSALLTAIDAKLVPVLSALQFSLMSFTFPLAVAQFVLHCFADRRLSSYTGNTSRTKTCPENESSVLSLVWFWWFNRMIALGYKRAKQGSAIKMEDLWPLHQENRTESIVREFLPAYEREIAKKKNPHTDKTYDDGRRIMESQTNIIYPLFRVFGWKMFGISLIRLVTSLLTFVPPTLLDKIITFVQSNEPLWKGIFLAVVMLLSSMIESVLNSQYEYRLGQIAMRVRSVLTHVIYCKALKLSSHAKAEFNTGQIVNLMSVDSQRIVEQVNVINLLWSTPLQITICLVMLWKQLGIATLGGVFIMILLIPFNGFLTGRVRRYQIQLMRYKDKRTKLMNEILNGIKVFKLYAWENSLMQRIAGIRSTEISSLRAQAWLSGFMVLAFSSASFLVALASFSVYVLSDSRNVLDANKAFVSLSLFNILKLPLGLLPMVITYTTLFFVSLRRVNVFLRSEELDEQAVTKIKGGDIAIRVENASFQYRNDEPKPALENINIQVKNGMLIAIVGMVGSGKSTLLSALLGDLVKKTGKVTVSGSIAYVPQQAWIQGASIKSNILFGSKYERAFYEQTLDVCALKTDLAMLPAGDETEVGENGINLSGGQKQRISLARAVYSRSDVYYLDDPLSAIDSHVSKEIFDKVIGRNGLLASRTRVLVTHRLSVLDQCDLVYVLKNGMISEWGTYKQLMARKGAFADFLVQYLREKASTDEIRPEDMKVMEDIIKEGAAPPHFTRQLPVVGGEECGGSVTGSKRQTGSGASSVCSRKSELVESNVKDKAKEGLHSSIALVKEEDVAIGSVKWGVFKKFFIAMGVTGSVVTFIAFVMMSVFNIATSIWLSKWSEDSYDLELMNSTSQRDYRLLVYASWGIGETIAALVASISLNLITLRGGQILHDRMLERVMHAPMSFFETTPIGRILNRFSKDIDTVDGTIRFNLRMVVQQFFRTVGSLALISMQTPMFLLLIIPLGVLYLLMQKYYIATSRQLKRLESISRSPVYIHFSETLTGCVSVRSYGAEKRFIDILDRRTDDNHSAYYSSLAAARWLSMRLEFIGYTIVFLATVLVTMSRDTLFPGYAGLSIAAALTITQSLNLLVKFSSDVEANFVSVERCFEYTEVDVEADWIIEDKRPEPSWPAAGPIEFINYSARYRDGLPLVVKNINIQIRPGEKVGVVGRTGAGKSSLSLALFRLMEAAEGSISINSVDISSIGLHDLRSRLTIIPQDPALLSGTLRDNLDPLEEKSDEEIWTAIEQAHLKNLVIESNASLSYEINGGGENLSAGQRQQVCLARALLRKPKILILDEATASVDMETDKLIQQTLRTKFASATTLATAHRLNTVVDYDRILVLAEGRVVEFDKPQTLIENPKSLFYSMAKEAGLI